MKFPWLDEQSRFTFPDVEEATPEGIVAVGGNLSPGMLISAYCQGIFPWFSQGEPLLWWSPDPRCVLFPGEIHVSSSMERVLKKKEFGFSIDGFFPDIVGSCKTAFRPGQDGTWITKDMVDAYVALHRLGYAHSVEVWKGEDLVGGLYGVSLGSCFFGESMFSKVTNASKAALIVLAKTLAALNFQVIDCQIYTPHLASMGAGNLPRKAFISLLRHCLEDMTRKGSWKGYLQNSLF